MKKKVSFFIGSLSYGGAERVTVYLAKYFRKKDIDVEVVTIFQDEEEYILDEGIKRVVLNKNISHASSFKTILKLRKYIKEWKPDLFIGLGTSYAIFLAIASKGLKTKVLISERNDPRNFKGKRITKILSELFLKYVDGYVFQTQNIANYYNWLNGNKRIIPNPIFIEEIPKQYKGIKKTKIVSVGRLNKQKNQKLLINSFSNISQLYPDYELHIYGEGPERLELENLITEKHLNTRIFLHGAIPDVLEKIRDASIFAFSSEFEGLPNALIEAMTLGLPIVTTDFGGGGAVELIENGINGIIVPNGDEEKFTSGLKYLLDNPNISYRMGDSARKISQKLNAEKIGEEWLRFSDEMIVNK